MITLETFEVVATQWVSPTPMVDIPPSITVCSQVPDSRLTFCSSVDRQPGSEASVVSDLPNLHEYPEDWRKVF